MVYCNVSMKTEDIIALFSRFEAIANDYEGVECWSARELSELLGYAQWRNFENIIDKARLPVSMQDRRWSIILPTSAK